jgi:hypothetical protein
VAENLQLDPEEDDRRARENIRPLPIDDNPDGLLRFGATPDDTSGVRVQPAARVAAPTGSFDLPFFAGETAAREAVLPVVSKSSPPGAPDAPDAADPMGPAAVEARAQLQQLYAAAQARDARGNPILPDVAPGDRTGPASESAYVAPIPVPEPAYREEAITELAAPSAVVVAPSVIAMVDAAPPAAPVAGSAPSAWAAPPAEPAIDPALLSSSNRPHFDTPSPLVALPPSDLHAVTADSVAVRKRRDEQRDADDKRRFVGRGLVVGAVVLLVAWIGIATFGGTKPPDLASMPSAKPAPPATLATQVPSVSPSVVVTAPAPNTTPSTTSSATEAPTARSAASAKPPSIKQRPKPPRLAPSATDTADPGVLLPE